MQGTLPGYALNERGGSCWKDNRTIYHGEQVMVSCHEELKQPSSDTFLQMAGCNYVLDILQDEWCNRCGCRDGELYCTRLPSCRYNNTNSSLIPIEDMACEECNSMTPRSPVYAKDQTFPSACHAMRCNGIAAADIESVSCQFGAMSCVIICAITKEQAQTVKAS